MAEHRFHTPGPLVLQVGIPAGDVTVDSVDGDESVVVVDGDDRLVEQTEVTLDGGRLVVSFRGRKPFGITIAIGDFSIGSRRLRVRASVPHGAELAVATASADVKAEGRFGTLEAKTASGDVRVRGEIEREATVKTVSGDVRLDRVGGDVKAQTVSGDVSVGWVGGSVETKSVSGDVRVESVRQGDASFTSVSGDVEVGIAAGSFLDVDAGSVSGDLSSEVPLASSPGEGGDGPDGRPARQDRERRREGLPRGLMRRLLSQRDARLLLAGQTLSAFGDWALLIVLAVWMKNLTGSSAAAGMTFFVFAAGSLAAPLGGLLADRVRRRPLMIATDCVLGVAVLLLLLVHDRGDVWLIYLVALLYGLGGTVFFPARSALLRLMLPEELLADANGALSSTREGLRIVAPLAGAGLYAAFGGGVVAVLDSATFAASAFFLSRMRVPETTPDPPEHHFLLEVTAGMRHVWRTLPLRQVVSAWRWRCS